MGVTSVEVESERCCIEIVVLTLGAEFEEAKEWLLRQREQYRPETIGH
jgi:hypothetical protein